jgi:hypothetical protein
MSSRFVSWLVIGIAAAFLVVATTSFSVATIEWLAFAIGIATLVASASIAYRYRRDKTSLITSCLTATVSAWTVVASQVFSLSTVQNLALASALALSGLAIVGLVEHEASVEDAAHSLEDGTHEAQSRLAAAA